MVTSQHRSKNGRKRRLQKDAPKRRRLSDIFHLLVCVPRVRCQRIHLPLVVSEFDDPVVITGKTTSRFDGEGDEEDADDGTDETAEGSDVPLVGDEAGCGFSRAERRKMGKNRGISRVRSEGEMVCNIQFS
jgi:hypothetical protein